MVDQRIQDILCKPQSDWVSSLIETIEGIPENELASFLRAFLTALAQRNEIYIDEFLQELCAKIEASSSILKGIQLCLQFREYFRPCDTFTRSQTAPSTLEKLFDAALKVFSRRGYHEATMEEIAHVAGVGKGTLYRYFKSKDDLYHQLLETRLEELDSKIQEIINFHDLNVMDMIHQCFHTYMRFFEDYNGLYLLILREWKAAEHGDYIKRALRRLYPLKRKVLEATQAGMFKPLHFETTFYGFMGFLHGVVQRWLDNGCNYSLLSDLPVATEILLRGAISEKARQNVKLEMEEQENGKGND